MLAKRLFGDIIIIIIIIIISTFKSEYHIQP